MRFSNGYTKEDFLEQLYKNNGNCYQTYTNMGIPYNTYYEWRQKDPDFDEKVRNSRRKATEFVEDKMWDAIKNGDTKMIQFYLRFGSGGAYSETQKVEVKNTDNDVDVAATIQAMKAQLAKEEEAEKDAQRQQR